MSKEKSPMMPHNIEAEQGLLGNMMCDARVIEDIPAAMTGDYFYAPANGRIFEAARKIHDGGMVATPVTLKNYFEKDDDLTRVGGSDYLVALAEASIGSYNAPHYVKILTDLYQRRRLIEQCESVIRQSYEFDVDQDAAAIIERHEERLFKMAESNDNSIIDMGGAVDAALYHIEQSQQGIVRGAISGITELDNMMNGFRPGKLTILAARPSMGKTAMALTIAKNTAEEGFRTHIFTQEMGADENTQRFLARMTGYPQQMQDRRDGMRPEQFNDIMRAANALRTLPITFDESSGVTAAKVRNAARRLKRKQGLDLVIIDYLGLMDGPADLRAQKVNMLAEITKSLKQTARELGIHILLLHQLSRAVESRENKRPQLSDLRDSGAIEQDADTVLFLYRSEYYLEREEPTQKASESDDAFQDKMNQYHELLAASRGKGEIIIGKMRGGTAGIIKVEFNGRRQVFSDIGLPESAAV